MFQPENYTGSLSERYNQLNDQLDKLLDDNDNLITNLANASALLKNFLADVNWVGFYLFDGNQLVLGPFQGLPACTRISLHNGVCGHAASTKKVICVDDVHQFPGHITCDGATQSEIVVPIIKDTNLIGVLDIDSPLRGRFSSSDERGLQNFINVLLKYL